MAACRAGKDIAAERYLDGQKIKSPLSRKTILNEFLAQNMEFKDGKFTGADEYMKGIREQYPDEFQTEENKEPEKEKFFVRGNKQHIQSRQPDRKKKLILKRSMVTTNIQNSKGDVKLWNMVDTT